MSPRQITEDDRTPDTVREEFWAEVCGHDPRSAERPAWHGVVASWGFPGLVLIAMQAAAAVSFGRFGVEAGWVAARETVSVPVFLVFLLSNGIGLLLTRRPGAFSGRLVFHAALGACALVIGWTHTAWVGSLDASGWFTGVLSSTP